MGLKTWKTSWKVLMSAALVIPAFGLAGANDTFAAGDTYKIVTFGDSLTAGYEPEKEASQYYGFVPRLGEQGRFHGRTEVDNYGISGLTSTGLEQYIEAVHAGTHTTAANIQSGLRDPNAAVFASNVAAARADVADADVITITIGGNDLLPLITGASLPTAEELAPKVQALLENYATNLNEVLTDLRDINPNARIVVADQYQPVPAIAAKSLYAALNQAAAAYTTTLNGVIATQNAAGGHVEAVNVAPLFIGREMQLTHIARKDIHPNQVGYEAIAKAFSQQIWNEYRTLSQIPASTTVAVVVAGKELNTNFKPILKKGTTFVVLRDITDALGADLKWNNKTATASINVDGRNVAIPVDKKTITVNGKNTAVQIPAFTEKVNGQMKTYVPLAVLADGLGFDVQYTSRLRTVFVNP
ncbi:GDSL-type esterase/lipase family protein [Saccharibacillus sp. JS10]|uniref:stalk domain-containing protein n=1 Tax=Saccharibacillus sp. JS10 TaxID=2950552 RepID=UPI00210D7739|nr:GDSL-type esterase/lipase family protein [Saccharibacillus sp. JS10]MCQ4087302.1 GDSL-type esterase/lipase family protein [Saccharibacillus sp. JS10]